MSIEVDEQQEPDDAQPDDAVSVTVESDNDRAEPIDPTDWWGLGGFE